MRLVAAIIPSGSILAAALAMAPAASAQPATPTPTAVTLAPKAAPTPIPVGTTALRLRIVDDLNRNGSIDAGETGLAGWSFDLGCGDAFVLTRPTDPDGYVITTQFDAGTPNGPFNTCIRIERPYGWLPTSPMSQTVLVAQGTIVDVTFLVYHLGDSVMETGVQVIRRGIPVSADVELASPYTACLEKIAQLPGLLLIVGDDDRPGCPARGADVPLLADNDPAGTVAFVPDPRPYVSKTLVIGGDSMRLSVNLGEAPGDREVTAAMIDGTDCAVFQEFRDFPPRLGVYVLSDEARPGCGAPGKIVRFYRDGVPLDPLIPWQAGWYREPLDFTLSTTVSLPNTGTASTPHRTASSALVAALLASGMIACALGIAGRAR